jgi:hypothetical protein
MLLATFLRVAEDDDMTYRGHVQNGMVVLEEPAVLPEGASVKVALVEDQAEKAEAPGITLYDQLAPLAGVAKGLPPDLAENHDAYLHGQLKK